MVLAMLAHAQCHYLRGQGVLAFARMTIHFVIMKEILTFVRIVILNLMTLSARVSRVLTPNRKSYILVLKKFTIYISGKQ
jgi:hypothetical protein